MTPKQLRSVARTMREFGIATLKMGDCELTLVQGQTAINATNQVSRKSHAGFVGALGGSRPEPFPGMQNPTQEPDNAIAHKVDELSSLMKLSDMDLVDQLFPDHTQEEESA